MIRVKLPLYRRTFREKHKRRAKRLSPFARIIRVSYFSENWAQSRIFMRIQTYTSLLVHSVSQNERLLKERNSISNNAFVPCTTRSSTQFLEKNNINKLQKKREMHEQKLNYTSRCCIICTDIYYDTSVYENMLCSQCEYFA